MSIQTDYREQVDRFCEQADLLSGKDVLEMAKTYKETEHGAMKKRRGIKKIRTGLIVAAVCVTATALTAVAAGAAGYGPLSTMFREKLQDSTTADLIDQGYLYEINQSFTDGIYRADLIGISGDRLTPQIIINFWIDDPEIAAANETIELGVYTLGVKQYENELDSYGWMPGTAIRDSETPNLYHASIRGYWVWMMTGEECVIDITAVNRVDKDGCNILDRTHMETRVTIPVESLRDVPTNYYRPEYDISLPLNGIVYHLNFAEYSAYHTTFSFYYQADHSDNDAFDEQLVMTVDGKEYRNLHSSASWCDRKGECGERGIWYVDQVFPGFDFDAAETVKLSIGTESVTLKDPSIPRYTEEDIDAMREEETVASDYYGIGELAPLSFNGAKYCVSAAQYYPSRTVVSMNYEADVIDDKAINEALILTVDGKDYSCIPFSCCTWRDTEGETGYKDLCFLNPEFPAIDYAAAQKITLTLGEQSVVLKGAQEAEAVEDSATEAQ